jgi:serine/threonine-protein kinase RsbW
MQSADCTRRIYLVGLDPQLAEELRALPGAEAIIWLEHPNTDALVQALRSIESSELRRAIIALDDALALEPSLIRRLLREHAPLRLAVVSRRLTAVRERELIAAGACRAMRSPLPGADLCTLFHDREFLESLFPGALEGSRCEEHELSVPSRRDQVSAVIRHLSLRFDDLGYPPEMVRSILPLVIDEALTNAMQHGNGWDERRRVRVRAHLSPDRLELSISDEGSGFDRQSVRDPLARENRTREGGRGLFLIESLMDVVDYLDGGATILMRRNLGPRTTALPLATRTVS